MSGWQVVAILSFGLSRLLLMWLWRSFLSLDLFNNLMSGTVGRSTCVGT